MPIPTRPWNWPDRREEERAPSVGLDPLPGLDKAMAIRDTVARLIADVYAGKLHPRIAAGLAPLMHLQIRVLEKTDLKMRLARVERQLRESIEQH